MQTSASSIPAATSFTDFPIGFPGSAQEFNTFDGAFEHAQLSPPLKSHTFPLQHGQSNLLLEDARNGSVSHRLSVGSLGEFSLPGRNGSIDGSDLNHSSEENLTQMLLPSSKNGSNEDIKLTNDINETDLGPDRSFNQRREEKDDGPPPWSEMKTKAGKERKRLPLACIACRRKKIRCSGEKPACKHCLRSRIPCVYKVTTRKAAPRTDYMAMLDKRLKRMEDRVIRFIPKESLGSVASISRAVVRPALPSAPTKTTTNKKRNAEDAFGSDLEDWAKSKFSQPIAEIPTGKDKDGEDSMLLSEGDDSLPSHDLQIHLAEIYFDFVYGQSYPLLHKPSFMRKLSAKSVPPVLVLAVCAISARFSSHPQLRSEPAFLRGESWAAKAREIALKRYDSPNITILIVYLLLGLHEFGTCQGGRSWMLGGMAQRMAYALQLHRDLDHDPSQRRNGEPTPLSFLDREIRRRTMWSCFLMDRFNSSGTERPLFVNEQFIKTQLPIKEQFFLLEISGTTETLEGGLNVEVKKEDEDISDAKDNMGVMAHLVCLVAIWGQVIKYVNLGGKERDPSPMWSPESDFMKLRRQVQCFHDALPKSLQFKPENLQSHATEKIANQFLYLHILYHQILLFLHRFALPASNSNLQSKGAPKDFLSEAVTIALESANQISILIDESMNHNVVAPFAGYSAFFSSTVHVLGVFSKNPSLEALSKKYLANNVKFLSKMKKYWGMFHFVAENLKETYRQHAELALRSSSVATTPSIQSQIFQYGDWFDRYPHGVSKTDYEDPATNAKREPGTDAVLGQKSDLQTVEEFFASLSPPSRTEHHRKVTKKSRAGRRSSRGEKASIDPSLRQMRTPSKSQIQAIPIASSGQLDSSHPASSASHPFLNSEEQFHMHNIRPDIPMVSGDVNMPYTSIGNSQSDVGHSNTHFWNMDLAPFGLGNTFPDQSTGWFMPFNVNPPDLAEDPGVFAGSQDFGFGFSNAPGLHLPDERSMQPMDPNLISLQEGDGHLDVNVDRTMG